MKRIIYFNPDSKKRSEMRFLAELASISYIVANTQEELLNWLRSAPYLDAEFDALLLGSLALFAVGTPLYLELIKHPKLQVLLTEAYDDVVPEKLADRVQRYVPGFFSQSS